MYNKCESRAKASCEREKKSKYGADEIATELEPLIIRRFQGIDLTKVDNYLYLEKLIGTWNVTGVSDEDTHKCALVQQVLINVLPAQKEKQLEALLKKTIADLSTIARNYSTYLVTQAVPYPYEIKQERRNILLNEALKKDPLLKEKYKQSRELISILTGIEREGGEPLERLEEYEKKLNEYKETLKQHRKPKSDKAINILRAFSAFLASCTIILAPVVAYKAHHGTLFKRTEGEQMLEQAEHIIKKSRPR